MKGTTLSFQILPDFFSTFQFSVRLFLEILEVQESRPAVLTFIDSLKFEFDAIFSQILTSEIC